MRNETTPEKKAAGRRTLAGGSYALAVTALIIAGAILVNLIVGALPARYTTFDVSTMRLFSIGEETKAVLAGLAEDVDLYYIYQSDGRDDAVDRLLDTYAAASDRLHVRKIDLVASPAYAERFGIGEVAPGSVVAVCGDKQRVVASDNMYMYTYANTYYAYASGFDGEGQITSAIAYVTGDSHPVMYYTTGHGELEMSAAMTGAIEKANIELLPLNLLNTDIPEDCDALICFTPSADFTEDEVKKVIDYLAEGGDALLCTILTADTPNFDKIMAAYRVSRVDGLVVEEDPAAYTQLGYLLMPQVNGSSAVTEGVAELNLVYSFAQGLWVEEPEEEAYTVTTLLQSTADSYSVSDAETTLSRKDTDIPGPFPLAVLVEHSLSAGDYGDPDAEITDGSEEEERLARDHNMTKLLYFTTPCAFSEDALSDVLQSELALPAGNDRLFANAITYLSDETDRISIPAKSMEEPMISLSSAQVLAIGNLLMAGLPLAVIAAGAFIFVRRRRR